MQRLVIGTRGSALALAQTNMVADQLRKRWPDIEFDIKIIATTGDKNRASLQSMAKTGEKGFWIKEIQEALLDGSVDIAVHSLKDLPTEPTAGLDVAAIPKRADVRDVLVALPELGISSLDDLPKGAKVGTSSVRRRAFLLAARPDLEIVPIRGNIETRMQALENGLHAVVLAAAGLERTAQTNRISLHLPPEVMLPAPAQGALALEVKLNSQAADVAYALNHAPTDDQITAERAFLSGMGAGCLAPVGALATIKKSTLELEAWVASTDGTVLHKGSIVGDREECAELGAELAADMLSRGGRELVEAAR